jgi:biotin operon repressor
MRMSRLALLALPLTFASFAGALDAYNGTFDLSREARNCPSQLRMNSRGNDVFLVDGQGRVVDQLTVGEVRTGRNNLNIGALRSGVLTVTEYRTGMLGRRTQLAVRSLALRGNQLTYVKADIGTCTYLKVIPRPQGVVGDAPALDRPARTRFISLDESFRSPEELFDAGNAEQIIAAVRLIKSATPEYHNELKNRIVRLDTISIDQLKLLFKLMYFTPQDQVAMTARLRELEAAGARSDDQGSEYQVVLRNLNLANDFASQISMSFYAITNKLPKLSAEDFISLARSLPKTLGWTVVPETDKYVIADPMLNGGMISELLGHLAPDMPLADKRTLLTFLRAQSPGHGLNLAADIFRAEHPQYTADELIAGAGEIYPERAQALVLALIPQATLDTAGARVLIAYVGDSSEGIAAVLTATRGRIAWSNDDVKNFAAKGITVAQFRSLGFTAASLRAAGFKVDALNVWQGYNSEELKAAFTLPEFKAANYNVETLKAMGYTVAQMTAAGFTLNQLNQWGGYNSDALKAVFSLADFKAAGYNVETLKAMGYTVAQMRAAGFALNQLNQWGGYNSDALKAVFSLADFKAAGYNVETLKAMGYTVAQMRAAGFTLGQLNQWGGYSSNDLKAVFSLAEFKAGGYNVETLKAMGYTAQQMKDANFTLDQLDEWGGYSSAALKAVFPLASFKAINYSVETLKAMGYTVAEMKAAGYTISQLNQWGGYSASALREAFSAAEFKAAGYNVENLKAMGFGVAALRSAGFDDIALFQGGFTRRELGLE